MIDLIFGKVCERKTLHYLDQKFFLALMKFENLVPHTFEKYRRESRGDFQNGMCHDTQSETACLRARST